MDYKEKSYINTKNKPLRLDKFLLSDNLEFNLTKENFLFKTEEFENKLNDLKRILTKKINMSQEIENNTQNGSNIIDINIQNNNNLNHNVLKKSDTHKNNDKESYSKIFIENDNIDNFFETESDTETIKKEAVSYTHLTLPTTPYV